MKKLIVGVNKLLTIKGEHVMRTNATTLFTQINREQTETNKQTNIPSENAKQIFYFASLQRLSHNSSQNKRKKAAKPSQETKQPI